MGNDLSFQHQSTEHVLFIGSTGEGKSSVINLLMDDHKAKVGDGADGVTFECEEYMTEHSSITYTLCDSVGLNEGMKGTIPHKVAIHKLLQFAKTYRHGFNLLVFVMKKGRIRADFNENHCVFAQTIFQNRVPCVLYVSECEHDEPMDKWRTQNKHDLEEYNFCDIVCGTTLTTKEHDEWWKSKREQTKTSLWHAIETCKLQDRVPMTRQLSIWQNALNAVYRFLTGKALFSGLLATKEKLFDVLQKRGVDPDVIQEIISTLN